ncbi:SiaB family protein kinase [Crenobacter sp. SG2305]|uniref:SiaB family protein kinase n=1 Tax=Crenobacter oryzisoli TaxID=3056844 RepID=UPI0025AA50C7|nr:SiaB family protein kinase [Crenobacter sp. SG2305]MDN0081142.1 SiaB family protein kinase [Crenobacter sp. SG2305]
MGLTAFHRFQDLAREENVVFYYTGYFSQSVVTAMGDALRQRLNSSDATNVTRRKLFSVFVEMAQNVVHYSADPLIDAADAELRRGALWVGEKGDHFYVVCANPIAREAQPKLLAKLEPLRTMTLDEIKQRYKEKLRTEGEAGSKGAGLGFLTVARDACEPIEFDFVDEPDSATTLFYLKATL